MRSAKAAPVLRTDQWREDAVIGLLSTTYQTARGLRELSLVPDPPKPAVLHNGLRTADGWISGAARGRPGNVCSQRT